MRDRSSTALPVSVVAYVAEHRSGCVEIIRNDDAVQVIRRSLVVDDDAASGVKQHRDCELVGEGHTNRGGGLTCRVLLIDLLDGDEKVLAVRLEVRKRAVDEPDMVTLHGIARHIADEVNVVEDDQPSLRILTRLRIKADVGGQRVGSWEIPERAVAIDLDLRGRYRVDIAINHATPVGDTVICMRRERAQ